MTKALSGGREGSLLAAIDRTVTGVGARLLETRLSSPSTDLEEIRARHDEVQVFVEARDLGEAVRGDLRQVPEIERAGLLEPIRERLGRTPVARYSNALLESRDRGDWYLDIVSLLERRTGSQHPTLR